MLKQKRKIQKSKFYWKVWIHTWIPSLREGTWRLLIQRAWNKEEKNPQKTKKKHRQQSLYSSHLNKATDNVREEITKAHAKKIVKWYSTPVPPPPSYFQSVIPLPHQLSHLPVICNNNKLGMTFLVQMRQSDKYGSVMNDEIINFPFQCGAGLSAGVHCLLQDPNHI